jgi:protein associated with RNAse G/E
MKLSDHPAELRVKSILYSFYKLNSMQNNIIHPYINLLRSTHNLILTGAPGTGKTYLARQIAEAMGAEVGFVQFHPSYDYTDFVEGLRPIQESNGKVGFERKDGVFKVFCAKALENLLDSQKSLQTLQQEISVRDKIYDFVQKSIDENTEFETQGTKNKFHIIDSKPKSIVVEIPNNEKTKVIESDGRVWYTKEPAVLFFYDKEWYNVIGQLKEDGIYYYCNIASPYVIEDKVIKYFDYDLDLRVFPEGSFKILDRGEYKYHKKLMNYSNDIDKIVKNDLSNLIEIVRKKDGPFNHELIKKYNIMYNSLKKN